jgi:hypothetical protein
MRSEQRPALTAPARGVARPAGRDEETACGRTKKLTSNAQHQRRLVVEGAGVKVVVRSSPAGLCGPRRAACHHGVSEDEQLSGAGDERNLVRLSGAYQAFVERDQLAVPAECCR